MKKIFHQVQEDDSKDEYCNHHSLPIIKKWLDVEKNCEDTSCVLNANPSEEHVHVCEGGMCGNCRRTITNMETLMSKPPDDGMCEDCVHAIIKLMALSVLLTPLQPCSSC
jgi:hypothetical protein